MPAFEIICNRVDEFQYSPDRLDLSDLTEQKEITSSDLAIKIYGKIKELARNIETLPKALLYRRALQLLNLRNNAKAAELEREILLKGCGEIKKEEDPEKVFKFELLCARLASGGVGLHLGIRSCLHHDSVNAIFWFLEATILRAKSKVQFESCLKWLNKEAGLTLSGSRYTIDESNPTEGRCLAWFFLSILYSNQLKSAKHKKYLVKKNPELAFQLESALNKYAPGFKDAFITFLKRTEPDKRKAIELFEKFFITRVNLSAKREAHLMSRGADAKGDVSAPGVRKPSPSREPMLLASRASAVDAKAQHPFISKLSHIYVCLAHFDLHEYKSAWKAIAPFADPEGNYWLWLNQHPFLMYWLIRELQRVELFDPHGKNEYQQNFCIFLAQLKSTEAANSQDTSDKICLLQEAKTHFHPHRKNKIVKPLYDKVVKDIMTERLRTRTETVFRELVEDLDQKRFPGWDLSNKRTQIIQSYSDLAKETPDLEVYVIKIILTHGVQVDNLQIKLRECLNRSSRINVNRLDSYERRLLVDNLLFIRDRLDGETSQATKSRVALLLAESWLAVLQNQETRLYPVSPLQQQILTDLMHLGFNPLRCHKILQQLLPLLHPDSDPARTIRQFLKEKDIIFVMTAELNVCSASNAEDVIENIIKLFALTETSPNVAPEAKDRDSSFLQIAKGRVEFLVRLCEVINEYGSEKDLIFVQPYLNKLISLFNRFLDDLIRAQPNLGSLREFLLSNNRDYSKDEANIATVFGKAQIDNKKRFKILGTDLALDVVQNTFVFIVKQRLIIDQCLKHEGLWKERIKSVTHEQKQDELKAYFRYGHFNRVGQIFEPVPSRLRPAVLGLILENEITEPSFWFCMAVVLYPGSWSGNASHLGKKSLKVPPHLASVLNPFLELLRKESLSQPFTDFIKAEEFIRLRFSTYNAPGREKIARELQRDLENKSFDPGVFTLRRSTGVACGAAAAAAASADPDTEQDDWSHLISKYNSCEDDANGLADGEYDEPTFHQDEDEHQREAVADTTIAAASAAAAAVAVVRVQKQLRFGDNSERLFTRAVEENEEEPDSEDLAAAVVTAPDPAPEVDDLDLGSDSDSDSDSDREKKRSDAWSDTENESESESDSDDEAEDTSQHYDLGLEEAKAAYKPLFKKPAMKPIEVNKSGIPVDKEFLSYNDMTFMDEKGGVTPVKALETVEAKKGRERTVFARKNLIEARKSCFTPRLMR